MRSPFAKIDPIKQISTYKKFNAWLEYHPNSEFTDLTLKKLVH